MTCEPTIGTIGRLHSGSIARQRSYFQFPQYEEFNVVWRGASEIIQRFFYSYPTALSIVELVQTYPHDNTYCPCVSWKDKNGKMHRYKLWSDVGEILWYPPYRGQKMAGEFIIEIWNTPSPYVLIGDIKAYTSLLFIPEDYCDGEDVELFIPYIQCTDTIFDLTYFVPADGDFWVIDKCSTTLVKDIVIAPHWWLQSINMGTWHMLSLVQDSGITFSSVSDNSPPPIPVPINHLPLIDRQSKKAFAIRAYAYVEAGIIKATTIVAEEVPMTDEAMTALYMLAPDGKYYGYRVKIGWTDNTYTVRDKTKDQITVDQDETLPPSL